MSFLSTPDLVAGLTGGAIIGLAAASLLLGNGDILGASGIVRTVGLAPHQVAHDESLHWNLTFLASFALVSLFLVTNSSYYDENTINTLSMSHQAYALAGVLVGFGTTLGNGCTSGHGICGLARLSRRSLAAVVIFMASAMLVVHVVHVQSVGKTLLMEKHQTSSPSSMPDVGRTITMVLSVLAVLAPTVLTPHKNINSTRKLLVGAIAGGLFAAGLLQSQMVYSARIFGFLDLTRLIEGNNYDPMLLMVMTGGLVVSFASYQFLEHFRVLPPGKAVPCLTSPLALDRDCKFAVPTSVTIDWKLLVGAACFGLGWGMVGLCPGPATVVAIAGAPTAVVTHWWPAFFAGSYIAKHVKNKC